MRRRLYLGFFVVGFVVFFWAMQDDPGRRTSPIEQPAGPDASEDDDRNRPEPPLLGRDAAAGNTEEAPSSTAAAPKPAIKPEARAAPEKLAQSLLAGVLASPGAQGGGAEIRIEQDGQLVQRPTTILAVGHPQWPRPEFWDEAVLDPPQVPGRTQQFGFLPGNAQSSNPKVQRILSPQASARIQWFGSPSISLFVSVEGAASFVLHEVSVAQPGSEPHAHSFPLPTAPARTSLYGRVTDPSGRAVPNLRAELRLTSDELVGEGGAHQSVMGSLNDSPAQSLARAFWKRTRVVDERFELAPAPPARAAVLNIYCGAVRVQRRKDIRIVSGQSQDLGTFIVPSSLAQATIMLRVRGRPVALHSWVVSVGLPSEGATAKAAPPSVFQVLPFTGKNRIQIAMHPAAKEVSFAPRNPTHRRLSPAWMRLEHQGVSTLRTRFIEAGRRRFASAGEVPPDLTIDLGEPEMAAVMKSEDGRAALFRLRGAIAALALSPDDDRRARDLLEHPEALLTLIGF